MLLRDAQEAAAVVGPELTERHILEDVQARDDALDLALPWDVAEAPTYAPRRTVFSDLFAAYRQAPGGRPLQPEDRPHHLLAAGPLCPDDGQDFAGMEGEADVLVVPWEAKPARLD